MKLFIHNFNDNFSPSLVAGGLTYTYNWSKFMNLACNFKDNVKKKHPLSKIVLFSIDFFLACQILRDQF